MSVKTELSSCRYFCIAFRLLEASIGQNDHFIVSLLKRNNAIAVFSPKMISFPTERKIYTAPRIFLQSSIQIGSLFLSRNKEKEISYAKVEDS